MIQVILMLITGLVTSLFLFPFNLPVSIVVNTKMILAVFGAALFIADRIKGSGPVISREFLFLCLICTAISIWALFVTTFNATSDYAFAKYIVSVCVWIAAAYAVVWLIHSIHGKVTVELVGNYLIAVCVAQCLLAYSHTIWPELESFTNSLVGEGEAFMSSAENRLHGLGAALDPAGLRFSAVLVINAYIASRIDFDTKPWEGTLYVLSFLVITLIGNMISRTTTLGVIVGILIFLILRTPRDGKIYFGKAWGIIGGILLMGVSLSAWLYNTDPNFKDNIRFGFEGFFSLIEKGRWETRSTDILNEMVIWPESLKTWVIGDGFFNSPQDIPNRFGQTYAGYYMRTDIGYLRYIYYFGCIGLSGMIVAFIQMTLTCIKRINGYTLLFLSFLLINLIGWVKVSSDIIMVFAPYLIMAYRGEEKSIDS